MLEVAILELSNGIYEAKSSSNIWRQVNILLHQGHSQGNFPHGAGKLCYSAGPWPSKDSFLFKSSEFWLESFRPSIWRRLGARWSTWVGLFFLEGQKGLMANGRDMNETWIEECRLRPGWLHLRRPMVAKFAGQSNFVETHDAFFVGEFKKFWTCNARAMNWLDSSQLFTSSFKHMFCLHSWSINFPTPDHAQPANSCC